MVPGLGCSRPDSTLIRVDLPAPFSPIMACTSPGLMSKSILNRTGTSPNDLLILCADRMAGTIAPSAMDLIKPLPERGGVDPQLFILNPTCKGFHDRCKGLQSRQTA